MNRFINTLLIIILKMQSTGGGNLTLRIVEGKLYRDTETFG
jgi:hypothetical protein